MSVSERAGLGIVSVVSVDKYIYVVTGEGKLIRVSINGSEKVINIPLKKEGKREIIRG